MDIAEVQRLKHQMDAAILREIKAFEDSSGLCVKEVGVNSVWIIGSTRSETVAVMTRVEI